MDEDKRRRKRKRRTAIPQEPVVMPGPATGHEQKDVKQVVKEMLEYRDRQKRTLGGITFRQLIDEGRRY